jgi:ectoine hydroxylase-related dioxygenase (phytanoyl-CoA dioxygenase family)
MEETKMTFQYSERHADEYHSDGLTILRDVIPAALLSELRAQTDIAREITRRERGPQAQRLQPVYRYPVLDPAPFRDFLRLPELRRTVEAILGSEHTESDIMGVLFEPGEAAWATPWHRDWGYNVPGIDLDAFFEAALQKPAMFNQLNAALYDDHSLWVVPGSHNRHDTPGEQETFGGDIPPPGPALTPEMTPTERELCCLSYTRAMPGAVQVALGAGDVAFYRAVGWHIGNYVPYTKRATLHDGFYGPDDRHWQANVPLRG